MPNKYEDEYRKLKADAPPVVRCALCGHLFQKTLMDPHHPKGRWGSDVLEFVWLHRRCHEWVHRNPEAAKEKGLLYPQIYADDRVLSDGEKPADDPAVVDQAGS